MADKWTAPRPDADEVPYWGVNDSFEEEGDDADADLDADGRKKLTVRQQCLRLFSLVIFVVLFPLKNRVFDLCRLLYYGAGRTYICIHR